MHNLDFIQDTAKFHDHFVCSRGDNLIRLFSLFHGAFLLFWKVKILFSLVSENLLVAD